MPAALPAMWRAIKRGYTAEPWLLLIAFLLTLLAALPDALFALWLMMLTIGLLESKVSFLWAGALGIGVSATMTWALRVISDRTQRRFRDRISIALESHVAQLQASVVSIAHHERPEFLDRLSVLRDQVFTLDHMYHSMFSTCGWIIRLLITGTLLASVNPLLLVMVLSTIPIVFVSSTRPAVQRKIEEKNSPHSRLAKHLFDLATTAQSGKELRLWGIEERVVGERKRSWTRWYRPQARARWITALLSVLAWTVFGIGYLGGVVFCLYVLDASAGAVVLVLAAGSRLAAYISATVGELEFLRGIWMDGARRLAWLEDYAEELSNVGNDPIPNSLDFGITFDNVAFKYPGTEEYALEDVNLTLKAGSVVALVGENGAGKTTLVKLLARMYEPTKGRILVDGKDLKTMDPVAWRNRLAGAFQDFFRFEFFANQTIGLGDVAHIQNEDAVVQAVERAGAEDVVDHLRDGLATQLGPTWDNGVEVSFGQWQKLSLARGFMRKKPLLLMLDEPTAALDAETEHALFEKYASVALGSSTVENGERQGQVALLVSHRFSTVRMADHIVVLSGARVAEEGTHQQLMSANGVYSDLYEIQAQAYR